METPIPSAAMPPEPAKPAASQSLRNPKRQFLLGAGAIIALVTAVLILRETNPTRVLARSLHQGDDDARRSAAADLSAVNVVDLGIAIPAIAEALTTDPSPEVRAEAARTTGTLAGEAISRRDSARRDQAVGALLAAFDDKDPKVRETAILTIPMLANTAVTLSNNENDLRPIGAPRAIVDKLLPLLDQADDSIHKAARSALGYFPVELDPALPKLLKAATDEAPTEGRGGRGPMAALLAKVRPLKPSVPLLVAELASPNVRTRALAAATLGQAGTDAADAVPALVKILQDPAGAGERDDPGRAAAAALGDIAPGTPHANEALAALQEVKGSAPEGRQRAIAAAIKAFEAAPAPRA